MIYVSIGAWCLVAYILERLKLRNFSLPFDWCFSNLMNVVDVIKDGLSEEFLTIPQDKWKRYYLNGYNLYFHRRDMKKKEDREYVLRCVERLKNVIDGKEKIVFIHAVRYSFGHDLDNLRKVEKVVLERNPKCNFVILSVKHVLEFEREYNIQHVEERIKLIDCKCTKPWINDNWNAEGDEWLLEKIILNESCDQSLEGK